ncbi:MAG: hypothetical protein GY793_07510 [Proteobacteria bacterium]|nr:hypothetical protein [Pseudomonadota bacterium]
MAIKKKSKLYEWQEKGKTGGKCELCFKNVPFLTVDHIIPITIIDVIDITGQVKYEDESNFQHICMPCNHFKSNRLDIKNPKTIILLEKYINRLK